MKKLDILLGIAIVILVSLILLRITNPNAAQVISLQNNQTQLYYQAAQSNSSAANYSEAITTYSGSDGVSGAITSSECVGSGAQCTGGVTNANFWYNEKFLSGNVQGSAGGYYCSAAGSLNLPYFYWNSCAFQILGTCIGFEEYNGGGPNPTTYDQVVGYFGFPETESGGLLTIGAQSCSPEGSNHGSEFPDLWAAQEYSNGYSGPGYCSSTDYGSVFDPGGSSEDSLTNYPNFFAWPSSDVYAYTGSTTGGNYYYAVNTEFNPTSYSGQVFTGNSAIIIPAISCGGTFPNNYLNLPTGGTISNIATLSGFTPSVGLAAYDGTGFGVTYIFGNVFWPSSKNYLSTGSQLSNIDNAFSYNSPTLNYAKFPAGNKGDTQYVNVSGFFGDVDEPNINPSGNQVFGIASDFLSTIYGPSNIALYESNTALAAVSNYGNSFFNLMNDGFSDFSVGDFILSAGITEVDSYSLPNLEPTYYPGVITGRAGGNAYDYDYFRTDGILPFCAWDTTTATSTSPGNIYQACTLENSSFVNPATFSRLWTSGFSNVINDQPYAPGYSSGEQLNDFTQTMMDSYCFYGENFNETTGVYTSPSYTRVIAPLSTENYTVANGECNAFYNDTNCFDPTYNDFINFNSGIFMDGIKCTPQGIVAQNVTDAWITSAYIANDAGDYCGYFLGQKDLGNPSADYTTFGQALTDCPSFNSNSSEVPLVITVKNVGNSVITNPYLVALFRDTNVTQMFTMTPNSGNPGPDGEYGLFQSFLQDMQDTNGVIEVRYNSTLQTDMYYYNAQYPLNPIPLQELLGSNTQYLAGPFNNSLLGMWMSVPGQGALNNGPNVIRTSNTELVESDSDGLGLPQIAPGGNATFTIEVPMGVFEQLLAGKYNVGVYFGNMFNVSWSDQGSLGGPEPSQSVLSAANNYQNPLPQSGSLSQTSDFNNEIIITQSNTGVYQSQSPPWQYLTSSQFSFGAGSAFQSTSIYSDSLNLSVSAPNSTQSVLNITATPDVIEANGTGVYTLSSQQLKGSSISCFATTDNIQDFSVLWLKQDVSPSNLQYAVQDFYSPDGTVSNILVKRWLGILFMPYADEVALNYNNLPIFPTSSVSVQLQSPQINQSSSSQYSEEAFDYFGSGTSGNLFTNLTDEYDTLSLTPDISPTSVPPVLAGFSLNANALLGSPSVIRIFGSQSIVNRSTFSNMKVSIGFSPSPGASVTNCGTFTTTYGQVISIPSGCPMNQFSSGKAGFETIQLSSSAPFIVEMYNNSDLNVSDTLQGGTVLMSSNITALSSPSGTFSTSLNLSEISVESTANGISLLFGVPQQYSVFKKVNFYLYYLNDTPFTCNIVNSIGAVKKNGALELGRGYYSAPNGTILCNVTSAMPGIRAVIVNSTNGDYLGSGDIGMGTAVQAITGPNPYLLITDNGAPVTSENVNLTLISSSGQFTPICGSIPIYNGILNYSNPNNGCSQKSLFSTDNYTINVTELGQTLLQPVQFEYPSGSPGSGLFLVTNPTAVSDNPSSAYNLTINSPIPTAVPVSFSLNEPSSCYDVRFLSNSPYPYAEIPYQVESSENGQCTYELILTKAEAGKGENYTIFSGVIPSPVSYNDNWLNLSSTQYNDIITTSSYTTDLLGNCMASLGPCLDGFSIGDSSSLGNLLVNNVSASQASISETVSGPIVDCFQVSFTASQQVDWGETGFGGINYDSNKLYQITNPSENVLSTYCFYNGAPVVTDNVLSEGESLDFQIANDLNSNFSFVETSGKNSFYVPPAKNVGFNGVYSTSTISKEVTIPYDAADNYSLIQNTTCTPNVYTNGGKNAFEGVKLSSTYYSGTGSFYCLFGGIPTYTSESGANNYYFFSNGENISLTYEPGVYNLTVNGYNQTLYGDCGLTSAITSSSDVQTYGGNKLFVLTWPQLDVNSGSGYGWVNYNPSDPDQNQLVTDTMPLDQSQYFPTGGMIIDTAGSGSLIQQCPINTTIENYTSCLEPISSPPVKLENGSYDGIEGIPNYKLGNYNNSNGGSTYGPAKYIGGGCLVDSAYSCAPTSGSLTLNVPSGTYYSGVTSGSSSVSETLNVYEAPSNPITTPTVSFSCSGWYSNQTTSGPGDDNTSLSCSYGANSGRCTATFTNNVPSSGLSGSLQASCNIQAPQVECPHGASCPTYVSGAQISSLSITGVTQSDPTGIVTSNFCGNVTDPIGENIQNGIASKWTPGVTKSDSQGYALAEVGGCLATRDVMNFTVADITTVNFSTTGNGGFNIQSSYSCPSGYSGTIESCASSAETSFPSYTVPAFCLNTGVVKYNVSNVTETVSGPQYGDTPLACNAFSEKGFNEPTVADACVAYHSGVVITSSSSYTLQYNNISRGPAIGVGLGVLNSTLSANISIPPSGAEAVVKDQYMSGLSVTQYEINNIVTQIYPSSLFLSSSPEAALFKSSVYPFDLMNIILLQNPYFKIYGIPGNVNGSIFDYALNIFTGGTSANCIGGTGNPIDYRLSALGEGELCSGQNLPPEYNNGIYISLGALNEGLHAVQFYSVSETGTTADPTVNIYDTEGAAYSVNSNCSDGNSRYVTSEYNGGVWRLNITSDEECNPINNQLYGYIINCVYQTPGNQTFTTDSQYYLAYNLPTVWNISYTLLVSPKSYNIIPVNVYNENTSSGTQHLSLYPPTTFTEVGIPSSVFSSYSWSVKYGGKIFSSNTNTITTIINGTLLQEPLFTVYNLTTYIGGCGTTYIPSPASGRASIGSSVNVDFTSVVNCQTTFSAFNESIPGSYLDSYFYYGLVQNLNPNWAVSYDNIGGSNDTGDTITITTPPNVQGTFAYTGSMSPVASSWGQFNTCNIIPGNAETGTYVVPNWNCSTTFYPYYVFFSGLPLGHAWKVNYNGTVKTSTLESKSNSITFYTNVGDLPVSIPPVSNSTGTCTTTYYPSLSLSDGSAVGYPQTLSNGTVTAYQIAGTMQDYFGDEDNNLLYSGITVCSTQVGFLLDQPPFEPLGGFAETYDWNVTYAGNTQHLKDSASAVFTVGSPDTFSVSNLCQLEVYNTTSDKYYVYQPETSSGSLQSADTELVFMNQVSAGYVPIGSGCPQAVPPATTTFTETGLVSGLGWSVNYDNQSSGSVYSSTIRFSVPSGQSYSYTIPQVYVSERGSCSKEGYGTIEATYDDPTPSSGMAGAGSSVSVAFAEKTETIRC